MSKSKVVFALCMVAFIAGCAAKKDDAVYADGAAVSTEPTETGKYK
ncbi:MAG: hypothetical protein IT544_05620 [Rhodobacteraceae bacterium]|nr:hypothetical protein [Paracoccaceae bacterium]